MSGPFVGRLGAVGISKEVTLGTFVAPTRFLATRLPMPIGSPDIDLLTSKGVRAIPDEVQKVAQGAGSLKAGKFTLEVEPDNIGELLQAAFGLDTKTGAGPTYTHTYARQAVAQLPTYSLWVANGLNYPEFTGCMVDKLTFEMKAPEWVTCDVDWVGSKYQGGGSTHTPSYSTLNPFKFDQVALTIGGSSVTTYSDVKLTIDNKVKLKPVMGGSIYSNVVYSEGFEVTLAATMVVEDSTEWDKFIAGTSSSFVAAMTSGSNSLTFNLPSMAYKAAPLPLSNGLIEITFQTQGFYDTGTTKTLNAILVNDVATQY
jgi:hypothetical protein